VSTWIAVETLDSVECKLVSRSMSAAPDECPGHGGVWDMELTRTRRASPRMRCVSTPLISVQRTESLGRIGTTSGRGTVCSECAGRSQPFGRDRLNDRTDATLARQFALCQDRSTSRPCREIRGPRVNAERLGIDAGAFAFQPQGKRRCLRWGGRRDDRPSRARETLVARPAGYEEPRKSLFVSRDLTRRSAPVMTWR